MTLHCFGMEASQEFVFSYDNTPTKTLKMLTDRHNQQLEGSHAIRMDGAPVGWISLNEAIDLFQFVNDDTPCSRVVRTLSSVVDPQPSTVSVEARRMISGYVDDAYPPQRMDAIDITTLRSETLKKIGSMIDRNINVQQKAKDTEKTTNKEGKRTKKGVRNRFRKLGEGERSPPRE